MTYDENYFKSINYTDYLSRRDRYIRTAQELQDLLDKLHLIDKNATIMDYGCAVGFLMEGFKEQGYNIVGYDISEWAVEQARGRGLILLDNVIHRHYNIITCLDVWEHMLDEEIYRTFDRFTSDIIILRIPCSVDGKKFLLDVSNRDPTHINCKLKSEWVNILDSLGYRTVLPLNLMTIYDTPGVMCVIGLKSKAYIRL